MKHFIQKYSGALTKAVQWDGTEEGAKTMMEALQAEGQCVEVRVVKEPRRAILSNKDTALIVRTSDFVTRDGEGKLRLYSEHPFRVFFEEAEKA